MSSSAPSNRISTAIDGKTATSTDSTIEPVTFPALASPFKATSQINRASSPLIISDSPPSNTSAKLPSLRNVTFSQSPKALPLIDISANFDPHPLLSESEEVLDVEDAHEISEDVPTDFVDYEGQFVNYQKLRKPLTIYVVPLHRSDREDEQQEDEAKEDSPALSEDGIINQVTLHSDRDSSSTSVTPPRVRLSLTAITAEALGSDHGDSGDDPSNEPSEDYLAILASPTHQLLSSPATAKRLKALETAKAQSLSMIEAASTKVLISPEPEPQEEFKPTPADLGLRPLNAMYPPLPTNWMVEIQPGLSMSLADTVRGRSLSVRLSTPVDGTNSPRDTPEVEYSNYSTVTYPALDMAPLLVSSAQMSSKENEGTEDSQIDGIHNDEYENDEVSAIEHSTSREDESSLEGQDPAAMDENGEDTDSLRDTPESERMRKLALYSQSMAKSSAKESAVQGVTNHPKSASPVQFPLELERQQPDASGQPEGSAEAQNTGASLDPLKEMIPEVAPRVDSPPHKVSESAISTDAYRPPSTIAQEPSSIESVEDSAVQSKSLQLKVAQVPSAEEEEEVVTEFKSPPARNPQTVHCQSQINDSFSQR